MKASPPSEFAFIGHLRQFWQGYRAIHAATRDKYPMNWGYHVMIWVIGASTTGEYGLRAAYETLIGRLTELTAGGATTEEDGFAARIAQEYVDFVRVRPWYEFRFAATLRRLWGETPMWGPHMLRKRERRYALTTEYGAKALYGWLIEKATHASYAAEPTVTAVVVDHLPDGIEAELPELKVLSRDAAGRALVHVLRYQAFQDHALALARRGVTFEEIAGNQGDILVSVLTPRGWQPPPSSHVLFSQPLLPQSDTQRVVMTIPVPQLAAALRDLAAPPLRLEHVYDY